MKAVTASREAVHADLGRSREIYEWVLKVCHGLGADDADLVSFEKVRTAMTSESPKDIVRAEYRLRW